MLCILYFIADQYYGLETPRWHAIALLYYSFFHYILYLCPDTQIPSSFAQGDTP